MIGNTRTLSPTVLNEFRFGYNSFFNTFGRELAFVRDVTAELAIPGMRTDSARGVGHSEHRHRRVTAASATARKVPTPTENKVFEFIDNVSWFRGTHSFKVGGSIRFDQFNQVGNQFSRGGVPVRRPRHRADEAPRRRPATAFADFLLGYLRLSECRPALAPDRSSARPARRTTSPTRGACATT